MIDDVLKSELTSCARVVSLLPSQIASSKNIVAQDESPNAAATVQDCTFCLTFDALVLPPVLRQLP